MASNHPKLASSYYPNYEPFQNQEQNYQFNENPFQDPITLLMSVYTIIIEITISALFLSYCHKNWNDSACTKLETAGWIIGFSMFLLFQIRITLTILLYKNEFLQHISNNQYEQDSSTQSLSKVYKYFKYVELVVIIILLIVSSACYSKFEQGCSQFHTLMKVFIILGWILLALFIGLIIWHRHSKQQEQEAYELQHYHQPEY